MIDLTLQQIESIAISAKPTDDWGFKELAVKAAMAVYNWDNKNSMEGDPVGKLQYMLNYMLVSETELRNLYELFKANNNNTELQYDYVVKSHLGLLGEVKVLEPSVYKENARIMSDRRKYFKQERQRVGWWGRRYGA